MSAARAMVVSVTLSGSVLGVLDCGDRSSLDVPRGSAGYPGAPAAGDEAGPGEGGLDASDGPAEDSTDGSSAVDADVGPPDRAAAAAADASPPGRPPPACSSGCCAPSPPIVGDGGAVAVADSVNGFSGTQGECGWSYGYVAAGTGPFTLLTVYNTTQYARASMPSGAVWEESLSHPPWLVTFATAQHPNGSPLQWNDRRWTSTVAGTITIRGHLAKADAEGGDGVTGHVRVRGTEIWSADIRYDDTVGVDFALVAGVEIGTPVDFLVDPNVGDLYDTTTLTAVIYQ